MVGCLPCWFIILGGGGVFIAISWRWDVAMFMISRPVSFVAWGFMWVADGWQDSTLILQELFSIS